jgi:hypothetical protein
MSKFIRTALTAVGVIASIAVIGVASAAAAIAPRTGTETHHPRPTADGRTVTQVKAVDPKPGSDNHDFYNNAMCNDQANQINAQIASGLNDLYGGKMASGATKLAAAVERIEAINAEGLCKIV